MQKMVKNWIFTLILCILLVAFSVLLVLDVNGVLAERYYSTVYVNLLAALALIVYIALVLAPMFAYYRGKAMAFLIGEIVLLAVTVLALFGLEFLDMFKDMQVGTVLGLALWLRCSVLIIRAYLQQLQPQAEIVAEAETVQAVESAVEQSEEESAKQARKEARERKKKARTPLWLLCLLILGSAVGVWQVFTPMLESIVFVYCIAGFAAVFGIVLCVLTVQNYRARPKKEPVEGEGAEKLPEAEVTEQLPEAKQEALPEAEKEEEKQPEAQSKAPEGEKEEERASEQKDDAENSEKK